MAKIAKRSSASLLASKCHLLTKTVKCTSNKTYASHVKTMTTMLRKLRGIRALDILTITKDEVLELLINLEEQGVGSGPQFLSALKKHALCSGKTIPHLSDPAVTAAAKAVKRSAKSLLKPCGTLSEIQFDELKSYLKSRGDDELFYAVVIAFRARLRIGELYLVALRDIISEDGFVFLRLRECKQNRDGSDINPDPKIVPSSLKSAMHACAARSFGKDGRLFGNDIDGRLRRSLPIWAKALHWPDTMRWTGPHVFRHGGTQVLDSLAQKVGRTVLSLVAQQSSGTFAFYARNAEQRTSK